MFVDTVGVGVSKFRETLRECWTSVWDGDSMMICVRIRTSVGNVNDRRIKIFKVIILDRVDF